ncbi:hypothetical protein M8C13_35140 [Crossiella sp. SN42]|uniref:hypothetical protein n=1 Tax=Crossiella sp. SN42 TaxID=2944808 RepID=UPI00207CF5E9|nr:hypothetical protein [Crossiella sp. SN42]MCO1581001.1 hypothetical protein [Crossiella sp. SN42]
MIRVGGGRARHRARPLSDAQAEQLVAVIATAEWKRLVRRRVIELAGQQLWTSFQFGLRPASCRRLARQSRRLLSPNVFRRAAARAGGFLPGRWSVERKIANRVRRGCRLPGEQGRLATARALQVLGVYACVRMQRPPAECQCLNDLTKELSPQGLTRSLREALTRV